MTRMDVHVVTQTNKVHLSENNLYDGTSDEKK